MASNTFFRTATAEQIADWHWTTNDEFIKRAVNEVLTEWTAKPRTVWVGAIGMMSECMAPWKAIGTVAIAFSSDNPEDVRNGRGYYTVSLALADWLAMDLAMLWSNVHGCGWNCSDLHLKDAPAHGVAFNSFSEVHDNLAWLEWHYGHKGDARSKGEEGHWWTLKEVLVDVLNALDSLELLGDAPRGFAGFEVDPDNWDR